MTDPQDELRELREANATLRRLFDEQADLLDQWSVVAREYQAIIADVYELAKAPADSVGALLEIQRICEGVANAE